MNLHHLRYFVEVVKHKSYTKAALQLRISQPALSKQIRQFEESLGVPLLVRGRNGITLTPGGRLALDHAERIFSEARNLERALQSGEVEYSGEFCCGISDNLAIHVFPDALLKFRERHPKIRLQVFVGTSSDIKREILASRCEIGVFFTPLRSSEPFKAQVLTQIPFVIVVAPATLRRIHSKKKAFTLSDLRRSRLPRIESRHSDYAGGFPAHFHSRALGLDDPPWIEVNHHEVKKKLVLAGAGYSILTYPTAAADIRAGNLIQISTPKPLLSPVYWVMPRNQVESPLQTQLKQLLLEAFGAQSLSG